MARLSAFSVFAACVLAAIALAVAGVHLPVERKWREQVHELSPRDASGQIHIVEIDAASIAAVNRWPWSRDHYARLVSQLDAAGVRSIAFDVDFSSASTTQGDAAFAETLSQTRAPVFLPTFAQAADATETRSLESRPIKSLRESASLASVMMLPDPDGFVRNLPVGSTIGDIPRPSLAAAAAGVDGSSESFYALDLSLRPASIPRHSFTEIENGRFDAASLRGKDVLVGATSIELFDRYAVPQYGVIPGVVVQAIGSETLLAGRFTEAGWVLPLLIAAFAGLWILRSATTMAAAGRCAVLIVGTLAIVAVLQSEARFIVEAMPAIACLIAFAGMTAARHIRADIRHRSLHDAATGLPNRRALAQSSAGQSDGYTIAMFIGNFEAVRAVVGEGGGNLLIQRIAKRLMTATDLNAVHRVDEAVLAWVIEGNDLDVEAALADLDAAMRAPYEIEGRHVDATVHFGIAAPTALDEAVHAAHVAYRTDERLSFHADAEQAALEQRISLLGELDAAIGNHELDVVFQPQLDLSTDRIVSVEALVRWNHPKRGFLSPDHFIPLAEQSNRIDAMTLYVLQRTIEAMEGWCAQGHVLKAAVNISARLLSAPGFINAAKRVMDNSGIPRQRLMFEVTESAAMTDPEAAAAGLRQLRALGVEISIDDYGTGQSSLSYLKTLPVSELKIDRSFVENSHRDSGDALLVRSTVQLAHELGLTVVAEGVEEPACLEYLRSIDCDLVQGYLIGKPMSAADVGALVAQPVRKVA